MNRPRTCSSGFAVRSRSTPQKFVRDDAALDGWLSTRDYVCGERFKMADVYVGSQIDWGLQFETLPQIDSFTAYAGRLRERDGYKAAKAIDAELIAQAQADE